MGKVSTGFSMSLDGFVAGPNDEADRVYRSYPSHVPRRQVKDNKLGNVRRAPCTFPSLLRVTLISSLAGVVLLAFRTFTTSWFVAGNEPTC